MKKRSSAPKREVTPQATVVASHGRHVLARHDDGSLWQVFSRGKKQEATVGDRVALEPSATDQAWLAAIAERTNLLYRSDQHRTKVFAANLDLVVLVLAPSPPLSPELVLRTWVACRVAGIDMLLLINKTDLLAPGQDLAADVLRLLPADPSHPPETLQTSLISDPDASRERLLKRMAGRQTLVLGQSGMGKSTLVNLLIPDAQAQTGEISSALNAGRHTTTHTRLYAVPGGGTLIDSPGFQAFGLSHLSAAEIDGAFEWMLGFGGECRFYNCKHINEPGCSVIAAEVGGKLDPAWRAFYQSLQAESLQARRHG